MEGRILLAALCCCLLAFHSSEAVPPAILPRVASTTRYNSPTANVPITTPPVPTTNSTTTYHTTPTTYITTTATIPPPTTNNTTPYPWTTTASTTTTEPPKKGKIWTFLVASSTGFFNYRHQADVCHAYQILHKNGIPDEQIIVMMPDDIAFNPENPTPGEIINSPQGENVYEGVPKDYVGKAVTAENFLNVLSGNKTAMRGFGSERVIESGPDDYIFINFVDHGGPGILCFGESDILTADDLIKTFTTMAQQNKFAKMFLYVEACHSGSMFDDLLPDNLNIIVVTAADPHENSFACYYDEKRQTYLADVFSATWMHDTEQERLQASSLHHQFERVRTWTNTSHVEEYGDLTIGSTRLSDFLGFSMDSALNSPTIRKPPQLTDLVSSIDVPIKIMDNIIENTKDLTRRRLYKLKKHHLLKMRRNVDDIMLKLVTYLAGDNQERHKLLNRVHYWLGKSNMACYKNVLLKFSDKCFNVARHSYVRVHLSKLVNMCDAPWITTSNILDAISAVCDVKVNYSTKIE